MWKYKVPYQQKEGISVIIYKVSFSSVMIKINVFAGTSICIQMLFQCIMIKFREQETVRIDVVLDSAVQFSGYHVLFMPYG